MHLKYLELFGFKTFPDKIRIPFDKGINVIVGPNGCGKTNIVDAVRFVMGEQSLRDLRLKSMDDIIFHGSNSRSRSSVALCRAVFENTSGGSFKYKDFSEIMLERRHYSNRETEYRINGIPTGYREYVDFFNESFLSRHYSIIDSSKINAILSYRPDEMRLFFEEVSGITKYKIQKKAAHKKLESSRFNLLRINDLYAEIEKRESVLEESAKVLEEYRNLDIRRRLSEFVLYERARKKIEEDIKKHAVEFEDFSSQLYAADSANNLILASITGLRMSFDNKEEEFKMVLNEKNALMVESAKISSGIEYSTASINNMDSEIKKKSVEIGEQEALRQKVEKKTQGLKENLAAYTDKLSELKNRQAGASKNVSGKRSETDRIKNEIETISDQLLGMVEKIQYNANKLDFDSKNIKNIDARIADSRNASEKMAAEISNTSSMLEEKEGWLGLALSNLKMLKQNLLKKSGELSVFNETMQRCSARKNALEKDLMGIDINMARLSDFIESRENSSEGVKKLMSVSNDFPAGTLSDFVEIEHGFEKAAWECAGEIFDTVVVNGMEDARKALEFVLSNNAGEIKILVSGMQKKIKRKVPETASFFGDTNNIDAFPFSEKIKINFNGITPEDAGIDFYYVEKSEEIFRYIGIEGNFPDVDIITGDGIIFFSNGLIKGAGNKNSDGMNIFINKNKLIELKQLKNEILRGLESEEMILKELREKIETTSSEFESLKKEISTVEMQKATAENDIKHISEQLSRLKERLSILNKERGNLESDRAGIIKEEARLKEEIASTEKELNARSSEKVFMENKLRDYNSELENAREEETALKIEANSIEQNLNYLNKQIKDSLYSAGGYERRIDLLKKQLQDATEERQRTSDGLAASRNSLDNITSRLFDLDSKAKEADTHLAELKKQLVAAEKELESAAREKSVLERKRDSAQTRLDLFKEKLIEIESVSGTYISREDFSENDVMFIAGLEKTADDKIKSDIDVVIGKIAALGDVNMNAAREFAEAMERKSFLEKQKKDLENSINLLLGVIRKLDAVSREKFNSSIAAVRQKFGELFVFLFGGGHADIISVKPLSGAAEGGEALEAAASEEQKEKAAGMEISVQIPGKKISGINILSQGERVLVAVSLLFAIFLSRQTPFCVIDEVDAPLDYANNARYNKLIREVSNYSQVVMVTHNKKTMEIGRNIFGVTSKQPGISGIVSVSMN